MSPVLAWTTPCAWGVDVALTVGPIGAAMALVWSFLGSLHLTLVANDSTATPAPPKGVHFPLRLNEVR